MRPTKKEWKLFQGILPLDLARYLCAHGWKKFSEVKDKFSIWIPGDETEDCSQDLLLPMNPDFDDYPQRISDALDLLESLEGRERNEILQELETPDHDLIRIDFRREERSHLSLEENLVLIRSVRGLFLSAACAASAPQQFGIQVDSQRALAHLQKLDVIQHSRDQLTIRSPVIPQVDQDSPSVSTETDPYERTVVKMLFSALASLRDAVRRFSEKGEAPSISSLTAAGVSAELCGMLKTLQSIANAVTFEVVWSPARSVGDSDLAHRVAISRDMIPPIQGIEVLLEGAGSIAPKPAELSATTIEPRLEQYQETAAAL